MGDPPCAGVGYDGEVIVGDQNVVLQGVLTSSRASDGVYPVFIRRDALGDIAGLRVDFLIAQ